ncbi:2371_t:CDS:2 [Funneliformis mosseae]|uniref:2371_t:CDS:1 n=1 Tax=Funneliformis mosseae TaxID=27381 RepID=A0A9N9FGP0_FUNMO|nr:2371_t:CDS:2 [Funneliformis mosseae]
MSRKHFIGGEQEEEGQGATKHVRNKLNMPPNPVPVNPKNFNLHLETVDQDTKSVKMCMGTEPLRKCKTYTIYIREQWVPVPVS